jgi:site-specific DNA-methyltransferase (adenine-specific)
MEPYYSDDLVTLYHGDCREVTEWLNADVLVIDPPYGIGYQSGHRAERRPIAGDEDCSIRDEILALWGDKPAIVFGRWDAPRPTGVRARLIWDKGNSPGMGNLKIPWGRSDEEVYVLGEGFSGARTSNVLRCQVQSSADKNRPDHPTPKPIPLMELLIAKCPPGLIADPFAGSGSTLLAAKLQGRRAIGVEIEERYCEIAACRLAQDVLPLGGWG